MAFGMSTIVFHFAVQQLYNDEDFSAIETFRILRTSMALNQGSMPYLSRSRMWPFIQYRMQSIALPIEAKLRTAFQKLSSVVMNSSDVSQTITQARHHAYSELQAWVFECQASPRVWRHYMVWPAAVEGK